MNMRTPRYILFDAPKLGMEMFESISPGWREVGKEAAARAAESGRPVFNAPQMPVRLIPQVVEHISNGDEVWGVDAVGAGSCPLQGDGVCVAVVDSGIDASHPAFAGLITDDNYSDFTGTGREDRLGHGTHCAGIIFGRTVAGKRIGVAPAVRPLVAKVADRGYETTTDLLESALLWAVRKGAHIISLSIGLDFLGHARRLEADSFPRDAALVAALNDYRDYARFFDSLMQRVISAGNASRSALVVAAAGNDSHAEDTPPYRIGATLPAVADRVLAVAALGRRDGGEYQVAPFSNTGADISAPGVNIVSSIPGGGYGAMSGTSQAAPHVAGVAALWLQQLRGNQGANPTPEELRGKLINSATRAGVFPPASREEAGAGLVTAPPP